MKGHDVHAEQPYRTHSADLGCTPLMADFLHVCSRAKYACTHGLIWEFLDFLDCLLMAAHSMPTRDNEVCIKPYIKLDPNLENSLEVFCI